MQTPAHTFSPNYTHSHIHTHTHAHIFAYIGTGREKATSGKEKKENKFE
jgi:hypothetical protein